MEARHKPKLLPWRSWTEWTKVYSALRSDPVSALKAMQIWKLRRTLPVRVELTASILVLRQELTLANGIVSETHKAALGLTVLRGVNLLTGLEQKAKNAMSIMGLAREIGLPEYLVDLRHSVAHGSMPSTELLLTAIEELWHWLLANYWDEQNSLLISAQTELESKLEKYRHKAKDLKSAELLYDYLSKQFPQPKYDRAFLQKWLVQHHSDLYDEAWAAACLYFHSSVPKFAEGLIQEALTLFPQKPAEVHTLIEEVLALCEDLKLTVSPQLKQLIVLSNTDPASRSLLELLLSSNTLHSSTQSSCALLLQYTQTAQVTAPQSQSTDLPRWKRAQNWTGRPIGSNSSDKDG
mmetsp:Transcript_13279/g.24907  ORF Transcript_13279/g.24907 Transcript_13279/m.24907 type:complete len:351 (-) Transcript_13279:1026-2078(-)